MLTQAELLAVLPHPAWKKRLIRGFILYGETNVIVDKKLDSSLASKGPDQSQLVRMSLMNLLLFRQNTYLQNKKHTLTCQRWDWLL